MIIYKVTNKINGKSYIGQTKKELKYRKWEHHYLYKHNNKHKSIFYDALKKYGKENFDWEILYKHIYNQEELDLWEIYFIKYFNTCVSNNGNGYNITPGGFGSIGSIIWTKERKEKLRKKRIGKNNPMYGNSKFKGENNPMFGKKLSDETKRKISDALKKRWKEQGHPCKGKKLSTDHKNKLSKSLKGRKFNKKTIEKLKKINTGNGNPMFGKIYTKEELEKRSKKLYKITSKDGNIEYVKVLSLWCRENNINSGYFQTKYKNTGNFYKGFSLEDITNDQ